MSQLSEDDSSDSSDEFLVPPNKIDLNSSFFNPPTEKPNQKTSPSKKPRIILSDPEDSEDDFDYSNENNVSSAELLSQVLKNLENLNNLGLGNQGTNSEASSSKESTKNLTGSKNNDLSSEIDDLLLRGESQRTLSQQDVAENEKDSKIKIQEDVSVQKPVEIHLPGEDYVSQKKKKKQQDLQRMLQNKINQRIRSSQLFTHKVGLLCWISHGFYLNSLANDPDILSFTASLVSKQNYPTEKADLKYLNQFIKWFSGLFKIEHEFEQVTYSKKLLLQKISDKKIDNYVELILLCIATLRGMGINCRLVVSLQPPPLKPRPEQLFKAQSSRDSSIKITNEPIKKEKVQKIKEPPSKTSAKPAARVSGGKGRGRKPKVSPVKNTREADLAANEETKKKVALFLKQFKATPSKGNKSIIEKHSPDKVKKVLKKNKSEESEEDLDNESDNESLHEKLTRKKKNDEENKKIKSPSKDLKKDKRKHSLSDKDSSPDKKKKEIVEYSTDDEFTEKKPKRTVQIKSEEKDTLSSKLAKNSRKMLSSDEDDQIVLKNTYNVWMEVYLEAEEKWICVDVLGKKINSVSHMYHKSAQPVLYVVAWNSSGQLKDVTRRYCPHWLTDTRKKRVDEKWWNGTLANWKEKNTLISRAEDEELLRRELEQPLPKTVSECKGHPLYAIARHLLKFEAFYPSNCVPLGHLKTGEAIYSRHCVHTLMSRETWARKARIVKPAQEPYKIVKSMPKFDKLSGKKIKDQPLELFGKWQTDPYIPPEAKDGKVPRNDYGNVDLFKMSMLPKGTVWINLPALNRVARKLNIDCAPACTGFNFGCRGALPAFEGFVVCAEYEDTLRDAWERDQVDAEKRNKEKREKRIWGNWRKLIKGLMIRERLSAKYKFKENEEDVNDVEMKIIEDKKEEKEDLTTIQKKAMEKKTIPRATRASKRKKEEPVETKVTKKRVKR